MIATPWSHRPCPGLALALGLLLLAAGAGTAEPRQAVERGPAKPISVVFGSPQGEVDHLGSIEVLFSKPMVAAEDRDRAKKPWPLVIDPPIRGTVSWIGNRALSFVPQSDVPPGTRITCRIPQGTKSLDGDELASDYVWEIFVSRPRLLGSLPEDHGLIAPDARIHLLFSSALGPDAAGSVRLVGPTGGLPIRRVAPDPATARQLAGNQPTDTQLEAILALQPLVDLAMDTEYRIEIDAEIPFADVSVGLDTSRQVTFRTPGPARIESVKAGIDGITLHLTAPVAGRILQTYLEVAPQVPNLVVRNRTRTELQLIGDFRAATTYTLRLRPGLTSLDDAILRTEELARFTTPHLRPRLRILHSDGIIPRGSDTTIRIEGANLDTVVVFAAWVPGDRVPGRLFTGPESWRTIDLPPIVLWDSPRQAPDSIHTLEIPLERFGSSGDGSQVLQIRARGRALYPRRHGHHFLSAEALVQITDVGLSSFAGNRRGLAWVTSLSTGNALEGAEVRLHAPGADRPLWKGTSSPDGLAWLPGISELPVASDAPLFAEVRTSDDAVWLRLDTEHLAGAQQYRGHITTDRLSYQPGENVRWVALVRKIGSEGIGSFDLPVVGYRITADRSGRLVSHGSFETKPPGDGAGSFVIDPDERPGTYTISLTEEPDGSGEPFAGRTFSVATDSDFAGPGGSTLPDTRTRSTESGPLLKDRETCNSLELTLDQRQYSSGDTARLTLSPSMDRAEALLLVFDRGIRQVRRISPLEGPVTVPIPLIDVLPPKIRIQTLLVGPAEPPSSYACGRIDLPIDPDPWRLDIDLTTERGVYEPGEEVTLRIAVRDAEGKPAPGTATIIVIQEAISDTFSTFGTDPLRSIFSSPGPELSYTDTRVNLSKVNEQQEGHEADGGMGSRIARHRSDATVHWEAFRPIGPDGNATIRFVPTAGKPHYRVRVLAGSGSDRFGYGETFFEIRKTLNLECVAPRFVYEGDEIEIGATVHSRLDKKVKVEIEADVEGAEIDGKNHTKVKIKPGEIGRTRFRLTDPKPEGITLRILARSKGHQDSAVITVPVRRSVVWDRSFVSGTVDPSIRTVIQIPDGVLPEIGGLTTIVSPSILGGLEETLASVIEQPHRSLEESAASLLAIAARGHLLEHFDLPDTTGGFDAIKQTAIVAEAILDCVGPREIRAWPSPHSRAASGSVVAFALYALAQAGERGYPIPHHLLDRIGREARGRLHRLMQSSPRDGSIHPAQEQATWLLFALTEIERHPAASGFRVQIGDAELLWARRAHLSVASRSVLGLALANLRRRDDADRIRQNWLMFSGVLAEEIKQNSLDRTGRAVWVTGSESRKRGVSDDNVLSTALFLRFLSIYDPGDEDLIGMISWILNQRRPTTGSWWNSRTTAWTLHMLVSTVSRIEGPSPEISGEIAVGSKFESFRFRGRDRRGERRFIPMQHLIGPDRVAASHQVRIETDGRRSVYFTANVEQARSALDIPAREEGLFLDRIYLDVDGMPFKKEISLGDRLFVQATILIPQDVKTLFIEDHLPAGISLMEPRIESDLDIVYSEFGSGSIRFYAEDVPAGSYRIRYPAIATLAGEYRVPGARADLLEDAEIYAISSPLRVRIKDNR